MKYLNCDRALNFNTLCLLFIALGIITRIAIYIHNPNFWGDEAMLAPSIYATDLKDILRGNLPAFQVAPLGFLLSVKALSFFFGYSEYVLRIIPLLAGISILLIAYSFAIREFDKKFACVFLFFLAISTPLLFYSIQFKQYATETLVSLVYFNSFCLNRKTIIEDAKIPLSLAFIVPIGMLFSNASIFVLAGIFVYALFEQWKAKQMLLFLRNNVPKILIIAVFLFCYYLLWLSQVEGVKSGFMNDYWKRYPIEEFAILLIVLKHALGYFIYVSYNLYINCALFACLFFFGFVFLFRAFREKRHILFALATIIILCFVAYFSGKFPLLSSDERLSLPLQVVNSRLYVHLFPIILIVPSFAIFKLLELIRFKKIVFLILIAMSCFVFSFSYQRIDSGLEDLRISELIETIEEENSAVILVPNTAHSYLYYQILRDKRSGEIYLLFDSPPHPRISYFYEFSEYSIFLFVHMPFENIFEILKNNGKKRAYFIFANDKWNENLLHQCYLYAKNNFSPEKTFFYESQGVKAILVEFE